MNDRRYIVDGMPVLSTWMELVDYNLKEDVEPLTESEICQLTRLERNRTLQLGLCEIRRVI